MSEIPERKVLKEVLANLKSKSLSSKKMRKTHVASIIEEISKAEKDLLEQIKQEPKPHNLLLMSLTQRVHLMIDQLVTSSDDTIDNMEIYIDALERYSINLDKTLTEIFEQAKKQADEQVRQQEELMKRGSTDYIK